MSAAHAPGQAGRTPPGRKAMKQLTERLRREERELAREVQERSKRMCYPVRGEDTLPRVD